MIDAERLLKTLEDAEVASLAIVSETMAGAAKYAREQGKAGAADCFEEFGKVAA